MVIRSPEPWPKTKRSTVEESRKPHEHRLSFEAIQLTRHQILQHRKPTRRKKTLKKRYPIKVEREPVPHLVMLLNSQLNVYWCGSRGRGRGLQSLIRGGPPQGPTLTLLSTILEEKILLSYTLRYQCTPKLTILPNFSYWYSQVHHIEFFQLQEVLRKKVSPRQSYNGKSILWINYLYLKLSTSYHGQLKCH